MKLNFKNFKTITTMDYKFISKEQTLADWVAGKIQCFHNKAGKSEKLNLLIILGGTARDYLYGDSNYYIIDNTEPFRFNNSDTPFPNIPAIPTDELYDMIKGEGKYAQQEEREIEKYVVNKSVKKLSHYCLGINGFNDTWNGELICGEHDDIIQRAKDLKILDIWFKPVYKEREVEVNLGHGIYAIFTRKDLVQFNTPIVSATISDLKKIIEAHEKMVY